MHLMQLCPCSQNLIMQGCDPVALRALKFLLLMPHWCPRSSAYSSACLLAPVVMPFFGRAADLAAPWAWAT